MTRTRFIAWGRQLFLILIPAAVFSMILLAPANFPTRPVAVAVRYSFLTTFFGVGLVAFLSFNIRGWMGILLSASAVLAAFSLSLLGLWISGQSTSTVLGGLLPLYDASNYYLDAQRLLLGGGFFQFSSWRPLFPGLLALFLKLTGNHLQLVLAIFSAIAGLACFIFIREVQRTHGPVAAVFSFLILFFYYRQRVSGMILSEHLGLAFGALGMAAVWHSAGQKNARLFVFGIFLISLGLNARPGSFFVLPALILLGAFDFNTKKQFSWKIAVAGILGVAAGFVVNYFVLRLVAAQPSMPFSNFANTIYGLVNGGAHFYSAAADHPELNAMQGSEKYIYTFQLALEDFLRNPMGLVHGIWKELSLFFSNTGYSVFSYMAGENQTVTLAARLVLYALSAAGLAVCLFRPSMYHRLVFAGAVGVLLSVPFVPPGDAYGLRLYAATMPFIAVVPALGLSFFLESAGRHLPLLWHLPDQAESDGLNRFGIAAGGMLVLLVIFAPVLVKLFWSQPVAIPRMACPAGQEPFYAYLNPGSYIQIHREDEIFLDHLPDFHRSRFAEQVHGMPDTALADAFDSLQAPTTIYHTVDAATYRPAWLLFDTQQLPTTTGFAAICGRWELAPEIVDYALFWPEQVTLIE